MVGSCRLAGVGGRGPGRSRRRLAGVAGPQSGQDRARPWPEPATAVVARRGGSRGVGRPGRPGARVRRPRARSNPGSRARTRAVRPLAGVAAAQPAVLSLSCSQGSEASTSWYLSVPRLGLILGGLAAMAAGWGLRFRPSPDAVAWRYGAAGERRTARLLAQLERHGWVVLHDLAVPGSRANIDCDDPVWWSWPGSDPSFHWPGAFA
jgi:Nuclease-related domain